MLQHFWDHNEGNLFLTSDDHEQLIVRTKNLYDLAIPSGNSIAASNLLRLYHIVQNNDYLDRAEKIIKAGAKTALENPFGFGQLLLAVYLYVKKPVEITIILNTKQKLHSQMVNWLNRQFIPNRIIAIIENDLQLEELQKYLFFKGKNSDKGKKNKSEFAFVCRNNTCSLPIYSIEELERHIRHF